MSEKEKSDMEILDEVYSEICRKLCKMVVLAPEHPPLHRLEKYIDLLDRMENLTCLGPASVYWMDRHREDDICDDCREAMDLSKDGGIEA